MDWPRVLLCFCLAFVYGTQGWQDLNTAEKVLHRKTRSLDGEENGSLKQRARVSRRNTRRRLAGKYRFNLKKIAIHDAENRNALCLDGSHAVFYLERNHDSKNWVIQLQEGGSCGSYKSCLERSKGPYGSSKDYEPYVTGSFVTSGDTNENPTFLLWNKVYIPYCSADVFVGMRTKKTHPYGMQMLGHFIVKAVVQQLKDDYNINTKGSIVLFGGASAGGLGMLANIDFVQEMVRPAEVRGYNDGGWFTLFPTFGEEPQQGLPIFFNTLGFMFDKLWDGFVDESCRRHMPRSEACLYGELVVKHLSCPIFVMVAHWDAYQLQELVPSGFQKVRLPPKLPMEAEYLTKFANRTHRSISRLVHSNASGVFSPACVMHTFSGQNGNSTANTLRYHINGKTVYKSLAEWVSSNGKQGTQVEQPLPTPSCNPSCCSSLCPKCRKHKEDDVIKTEALESKGGSLRDRAVRHLGLWLVILHFWTYWKEAVSLV